MKTPTILEYGWEMNLSIQKFILQIFSIINGSSVMYSEKKAQYDFPNMRGGGSKAVWNFSQNSSVLETPSFPYMHPSNVGMVYPIPTDIFDSHILQNVQNYSQQNQD